MGSNPKDIIKIINKRFDILYSLHCEPKTKPELVDEFDVSRSTIDRGISSFEDLDYLERNQKGEFQLTYPGELITQNHISHRDMICRIDRAKEVLSNIDRSTIEDEFFSEVEVYHGNSHVSGTAFKPIADILKEATSATALLKSANIYYPIILKEQIKNEDLEVEIVAEKEIIDTLLNTVEDEMNYVITSDNSSISITKSSLPFSAWIISTPEGNYSGITVHKDGAIKGTLINNTSNSINMIKETYSQYKETASKFSY